MFIPILGNDPIWLIYFNWVETTKQYICNYSSHDMEAQIGEVATQQLDPGIIVRSVSLDVSGWYSCTQEPTCHGAASEACPMGWLPSLDHLLHSAYIAAEIADVLWRKKRRVSRKTKHIIRALKSAAYSWVVQIDDAAVSIVWPLTKSYSNSFSTVDCLHSTSIRNGEFATFNTKTLSYRGPLFSQKYAISEKLAKDASRYLLSSILMIGALGKPKGS